MLSRSDHTELHTWACSQTVPFSSEIRVLSVKETPVRFRSHRARSPRGRARPAHGRQAADVCHFRCWLEASILANARVPTVGNAHTDLIGFIPASARKPDTGRAIPSQTGVHPRLRGEALPAPPFLGQDQGPSPPTRGSRRRRSPNWRASGSIPAYAGKPRKTAPPTAAPRVHPRLRGEALVQFRPEAQVQGPSPPTRGSRRGGCALSRPLGSIPAYAGKPAWEWSSSLSGRVHPRLRGKARGRARRGQLQRGPSPPTRGSPTMAA